MNDTRKLLKSEKIEITALIIGLLNISLWLLGVFYDEELIGLAFALWYPTMACIIYLSFMLLPDVKLKEHKDKVYAPMIKSQQEAIESVLSMFKGLNHE